MVTSEAMQRPWAKFTRAEIPWVVALGDIATFTEMAERAPGRDYDHLLIRTPPPGGPAFVLDIEHWCEMVKRANAHDRLQAEHDYVTPLVELLDEMPPDMQVFLGFRHTLQTVKEARGD